MTTNLEVPTPTAYALNTNWLEQQATTTTNCNLTISGNTATQAGYYSGYWPNTTYWCYPVREHRPIKLGMSEVEKLRSAAKRDAKLKKILEKFTDQIEVVVDFK